MELVSMMAYLSFFLSLDIGVHIYINGYMHAVMQTNSQVHEVMYVWFDDLRQCPNAKSDKIV